MYVLNKASAQFFLGDGAVLLKALAEGKPMQYRLKNGDPKWIDVCDDGRKCNFDPQLTEWRVKPEPEVTYVVINGSGEWWYRTPNKELAEKEFKYRSEHGMNGPYVLKKFQEVM